MTDYTKLAKELRGCKDIDYCTDCPRMANGYVEFCNIKDDAAAAIEALQAQLPKRGEWIRVQKVDIPGEMHPAAFKCMCSMCRNEYLFPKIPRYCPDCGSMNTAKMEETEDEVHSGI